MDLMTIIGLLAGLATVYYVMAEGSILHLLFNTVALVLVFGGTLSATLISYPWETLKYAPGALKLLFTSKSILTDEGRVNLIDELAAMAEKVRTESIDALHADMASNKDEFLVYGINMAAEGLEQEIIKDNLEKRLLLSHQHNQKVSGVFRTMATFSPIFGLLGTLIGVVQVLRNLSDPSSMGASMAIAITTTFYGIFAANFLFLPAAIKLGEHNESETLRKQIIAEGVIAISQGDLPLMVRKKLGAFILGHLKERIGKK